MDMLLPAPLAGLECPGRLLWHAGSRRSILLVEAPRSADATACSHVESVAAVVAALPDVAERCSFPQLLPGAPEPAGSSSCSLDTGQVRLPCRPCLAMRGVFWLGSFPLLHSRLLPAFRLLPVLLVLCFLEG